MARARKPVDETKPTGANGVLFINYDLDDSAKAAFKKWRELHADDLVDMMNGALEKGYQISIKEDTFNDCIGAYLIAKGTKTENDGFILCGRSSSAVGALFGVLYRHYAVFDEQWPVHNHRANTLDDD